MSEEIEDLIQHIYDQDFSKAGPMFNDILANKVSDALEQERIIQARAMFSDPEDDNDLTEDEIEDALDEEDWDTNDEWYPEDNPEI